MKRIFMLSSQLMFSGGVENLLMSHPGIEIIGRASDATLAIEQIRALQPDVVIVDSKDLASTPAMIVASTLKEAPAAKVIVLNLANDQIRVYHGMQRTARDVDDLLDAMESDFPGGGQIKSNEWMALAASRSQVYEFHAGIYNNAVDKALLENLRTNGIQITGTFEQGDDLTGDLQEGAAALQRFQSEMDQCAPEAVRSELEQEYTRLLEYGAPGCLQAHESFYTCKTGPSRGLVQVVVMKAYTEAGAVISAEMLRQPDFIGSELDFMGQLCAQEHGAWQKSNRRAAIHIQALESAFLKDHLIRWAPRYCDFLIGQAKLDFYRGMAYLTKGFVLNEAYRVAELMEWNCLSRDCDEVCG